MATKIFCNFLGILYALLMAWIPPVKYLKRKELLDEDRFFRLLGLKSKFVDRDTAFIFYMGLVELIGAELRVNKFIRLPHIGDIALVMQKPRPAWVGKAHVVIGSREVLKVYPKEHLRRYFAERQGPPRITEIMPPKPIGNPVYRENLPIFNVWDE
jgi:hypothetical protein